MRARVMSTATGDVLIESALVVTIRDGRRGFSTRGVYAERLLADSRVTLAGPDLELTGVADVVRSGMDFEEVRGRTGEAEGWLGRWRRRRDDVVVLVIVD